MTKRAVSSTVKAVSSRGRGIRRPIAAAGLVAALVVVACSPQPDGGPGATRSSSSTAEPATSVSPATEPTTSSPPASETSTPPTAATAPPAEPVEHWITVDEGRLVDRRAGNVFVPRGVNLLRKLGSGGDKLFLDYDSAWVEEQLAEIAALGYNTVRVFADMCMECTSTADGIRPDFLDDLTHLITRVAHHDLVVMLTSNDVPDPGYSDRLPCCAPFGGYRNSLYLSPEGADIAVEYFTDLVGGLQERGAPLEAVFAWQLANEWFVLRDVAPISLRSGSVTAADGRTYDLGDDEQVVELVSSSLSHYIEVVGDSIRELDPDGLVTMGFFAAADPAAGRDADDVRWVLPSVALSDDDLDLVDLHAYSGLGATWEQQVEAFGLTSEIDVPIVLGEFGAFRVAHPDIGSAAESVVRWQVESCAHRFDGWLAWLWGGPIDDEVYTLDADDATIGRALAPQERPDPCEPGDYVSDNLALGRPVTASASESDEYGPTKATDGTVATWWSAADGAPQWVQIDLAEPSTVAQVRLLVGPVTPPGRQVHRVIVFGPDLGTSGWFVGDLAGDAVDGAALELDLDPPVDNVTSVRIETVEIDGWVIIHEVELAGP